MISHRAIKGQGEEDFRVFNEWLASTAELCQRLWEHSSEYYPFHDNEASAVSILLAGAARASYLPVSEYRLRKHGRIDKRERRDGRADLWYVADKRAFSFEFKRSWSWATLRTLRGAMFAAQADIQCIPTEEYDHAYAAVVAPVYEEAESGCYDKFAQEVDLAFSLGSTGAFQTYLYFDRCR